MITEKPYDNFIIKDGNKYVVLDETGSCEIGYVDNYDKAVKMLDDYIISLNRLRGDKEGEWFLNI